MGQSWRSRDRWECVLLRDGLSHKRTVLSGEMDLASAFQSLTMVSCLRSSSHNYEQHTARPSLRLADTDAKSWLCRGGGPDDWDWNRGEHHYLQLDALHAAESVARRRAGGAHRRYREHGAGRRADYDFLPGLPRFPRQS